MESKPDPWGRVWIKFTANADEVSWAWAKEDPKHLDITLQHAFLAILKTLAKSEFPDLPGLLWSTVDTRKLPGQGELELSFIAARPPGSEELGKIVGHLHGHGFHVIEGEIHAEPGF